VIPLLTRAVADRMVLGPEPPTSPRRPELPIGQSPPMSPNEMRFTLDESVTEKVTIPFESLVRGRLLVRLGETQNWLGKAGQPHGRSAGQFYCKRVASSTGSRARYSATRNAGPASFVAHSSSSRDVGIARLSMAHLRDSLLAFTEWAGNMQRTATRDQCTNLLTSRPRMTETVQPRWRRWESRASHRKTHPGDVRSVE
jgi:hypothetical protein